MNSILIFQLIDCRVVLSTEDGNIYNIQIMKDDYLYDIGGPNAQDYIKWKDGELYMDSEDQSKKDEFPQLFPQYNDVIKHIGVSSILLYRVLQKENLTYEGFLQYLKESEPLPESSIKSEWISGIDIRYDKEDRVLNLEWRDTEDDYNVNSVGLFDYTTSSKGNPTTIGCISKYAEQMKLFLKYPASLLIQALRDSQNKFRYHIDILVDFVQDYIRLVAPEKFISQDFLDLSGNGELICIHSPESERSDYSHGIPVCTTLVRESLWNSIVTLSAKYKGQLQLQKSYSTPPMEFFIDIDIYDLINRCKIIKNLTSPQIEIIEQIKDDKFIDFVIEEIQQILEENRVEISHDDIEYEIECLRDIHSDKIPRVIPKKQFSYVYEVSYCTNFDDLDI